MINNGEKSKPIDRYPFMENDLKRYVSMQDDIKKLQGDVQEISEVLNALSENVINLNRAVESLTEVTLYKDFFILSSNINYMQVVECSAFKVGNSVQIYLELKITETPENWRNGIGNFDYSILPRPIKMFNLVDMRFIAKVARGRGGITMVPVNPDYITANTVIALTGFYVIDVGGA